MSAPKAILVINPNSTKTMTDALESMIAKSRFGSKSNSLTTFDFFTAPNGPKSINNDEDVAESVKHVLPELQNAKYFSKYDGFLVACYSKHPLVQAIRRQLIEDGFPQKRVTGIFEASVSTSLQLTSAGEKFGIISTGKVWEKSLTDAVISFLGATDGSDRFAGVETTGLNATELHDASPKEVSKRVKDATRRLLQKGSVEAICLGCAGMSGMDDWIREAATEELGEEKAGRIAIVDGVMAGIGWLTATLLSGA